MEIITEETIAKKLFLNKLIQKAKEKEVRISKNFVATNKILNASEIRRLALEKRSIAFMCKGYKEINSAAFYNSMRFNVVMQRIEAGTLYYTKKISKY